MHTDAVPRRHLNNAPLNTRYLSPGIQNQFIALCGDQIKTSIVNACNTVDSLSLMADEATDKSTKDQITVCVRFVQKGQDKSQLKIRVHPVY